MAESSAQQQLPPLQLQRSGSNLNVVHIYRKKLYSTIT